MTTLEHPTDARVDRRIGILMAFIALTLVVGSFIHLAGFTPAGTTSPFNASHAGVAEGIIAVVLGYGALSILRSTSNARITAIATTGFAIAGFLLGLSITARGGDTPDVVYHVVMLPVLVGTLILLLRSTPQPHSTTKQTGRG